MLSSIDNFSLYFQIHMVFHLTHRLSTYILAFCIYLNCFYLRYVSCIIAYVRDSQIGLLYFLAYLSISAGPMENLVNCNKNWIFVTMSLNQLIYVQSQSIFLTKWTQNFNFKLQSWICALSEVNHHHEIMMILSYLD